MRNEISLLVLGAAVLVGMGGCATYVVDDPYYDSVRPVIVAPPPLRHEAPGYPPVAGFVWITGYWNWIGASYVWVPGRWIAPRPGHIWVPHRWERDGDHWRQHGGRWEQEHRPMAPPSAPRTERREERRPPPNSFPAIDLPRGERRPDPAVRVEERIRHEDKADRRSDRDVRRRPPEARQRDNRHDPEGRRDSDDRRGRDDSR